MAYNEKQKQTTIKYQEENLDTIRFRVRRGEKAALEAEVARAGYSAYSRYIIDAINEKAGREVLTMPVERGTKRKPAEEPAAEPERIKIVMAEVPEPEPINVKIVMKK